MMRKAQRLFAPGSEWLYFKLYTGSNFADSILSDGILKIVYKLEKENLLKKWFFVRYSDPDFHLRIRFLLYNPTQAGIVINYIYRYLNGLLQNHSIWRVQIDTYRRELERYSGLIDFTESIFHVDSECITKILNVVRNHQNNNIRWLFALKMIDQILEDFKYDLSAKSLLLEEMRASFKKEFGFNEVNSKQIDKLYRKHSTEIESVLEGSFRGDDFRTFNQLLSRRSKDIRSIITDALTTTDRMQIPMTSYIHMTMNRMFRSKNRTHELILYSFLARFYYGVSARIKRNI